VTSTAIVVPTYCEAGNLPTLAARLAELDDGVHVLVVDDASPDGTGAMADELAAGSERFHVLHRTGARGYAGACRDGIAWALDADYDLVMTMDADLSHDPARIPGLIAAVEGGADLAIGSRYVPGGALVVDWSPFRHVVSKLGSTYARIMVGTKVRDCTSGFRCYRASVLREAAVERTRSEGYSFLIEVLSAMRRLGARIVELPITYVDRRAGSSKISRRIIVEAFLLATREGVARALGRRRVVRG
jgi:dolichol-phosphate mannosyltransferase